MKKILVLLCLNMFSIVPIMAFYVDSINYAITSDTTVEVTSPQDFVPSNLFIPEQITYEGKVYNVTSIGDSAFVRCPLTFIEIPNSVTTIGKFAFFYVPDLSSVYCMAEVPPTLEGVLSDRIIDNLFVPLGCARTYKQSPWVEEFKYIVEDGYDANVIDIDTTSATLCWAPQPNVTQYVINVYENENPYAEFIVNADGTIVSEKYADDISPTQSNQSFCGRKRKVSSESGIELPLMKIITDTTTNSTDYFVITLNNLQPGTDYSYTVQGMNVKGESIYEDTGTFTTLTSNYLEVIFTNEQKKYETTKFYYKGTIYIRSSNGDVYNMRGIKVN